MRSQWLSAVVLCVAALAGAAQDAQHAAAGLKSKDEKKVEKAVAELAGFGRAGAPYLGDALADPRAFVRLHALVALAKLGPTAATELEKVVARAQEIGTAGEATLAHAYFNSALLEGAIEMGSAAGLRRFGDPSNDAEQRELDLVLEARVALLAVGRIGQDEFVRLFELVSKLPRGKAPNEFTLPRLGTALALGRALAERRQEAYGELWPIVERGLAAEELPARLAALVAVSSLGGQERSVVAQLPRELVDGLVQPIAARLQSEDAAERAVSAAVLGHLRAPCDPYGLALEPLLADPSPYARVFAALALRNACGASPQGEGVLLASLSEPDDESRIAAIETLNGFGQVPPAASIESLIRCLDSKNERVLAAALDALRALGPQAKAAGSKASSLMKHKSYTVRRAAERALERIR